MGQNGRETKTLRTGDNESNGQGKSEQAIIILYPIL